jgi:hypothetical protein
VEQGWNDDWRGKIEEIWKEMRSFAISLTTALTGPHSVLNPRFFCEQPASNISSYGMSLITHKGHKGKPQHQHSNSLLLGPVLCRFNNNEIGAQIYHEYFLCGEGPRSSSYGRTAVLRLLVQPCDEDKR